MEPTLYQLPWNSQKALRWEKIRARGKGRFIIFNGIILDGGLIIIFLNVIQLFVPHNLSVLDYFIIYLLLSPLAGILAQVLIWNSNEALYQYFISESEIGDSPTPY